MIFDDVVDAIGHTPLVRLRFDNAGPRVYAKLEMQNLFSMKDRVARQMILEARRTGRLQPGAPIVESSSGSMALGLAIVGRALGHEVHIVTDPRIDPITLAKLRATGCAVHVVPAMTGNGWQSARLERLAELRETLPGAFWPQQYSNPDNPGAYTGLAKELIADLGTVDVLVGSAGSGGSLCGTAGGLRRAGQNPRVIAVDSVGSVLFGQPDRPARLQSGLGNSLHPANLDPDLIDEVHWLNDREAFAGARALAADQQMFGGNTAGSVYRVLRMLASDLPAGTTVVGIFPDRGDRYAETVFDDGYWIAKHLYDMPERSKPEPVPYGREVSSWSNAPLPRTTGTPRLAFVESNTTGSGMTALERCREAGFDAVLFTSNPSRYLGLDRTGAHVVECDTNDPVSLRAAIGDSTYAGITTTSDFYLATVADLAAGMGLPGNRPSAVRICRDKARTRDALAAAGVSQPRYAVVRPDADPGDAIATIGLPCIIKPCDDTGSNNVRLCHTTAEAVDQVATIRGVSTNMRGQRTSRVAVVEEYIDGPEYSVETFSIADAPTFIGITAKHVTRPPHFVETGHLFPAVMPAETADDIWNTVQQALKAVGYAAGPAHTEVRIDPDGWVRIIEINARLAGGMIPELVREATGVDLLNQQLAAASGRPVDLAPVRDRYAGIRFLTASHPGWLRAAHGLPEARAEANVTAVDLRCEPGAAVAPANNTYGRLGSIIAAADTSAEVEAALDRATGLITLIIEPADNTSQRQEQP
jgi:cysteine synthase A